MRFSSSRYSENEVVGNGADSVGNTTSTNLMDEGNCPPHHSIVDLDQLLASSAAAYAHKPNLSTHYETDNPCSSLQEQPQQHDLNHASIMGKAPVAINGTKKKNKTSLNGGVPLFNHKNARDWIHKRAAYNKDD